MTLSILGESMCSYVSNTKKRWYTLVEASKNVWFIHLDNAIL